MKNEDWKRLICRMNEIPEAAEAAVLVVMNGGDIKLSTFGAPRFLSTLKSWIGKNIGGREV